MTFYDTRQMTLQEKQDLCQRARELCFIWWVDELDCSKNWFRQRVMLTWDVIMEKLTDRSHFTVIYRNLDPENYLEVNFRTSILDERPDYVLWILVKPEHIPELTKGLPRKE